MGVHYLSFIMLVFIIHYTLFTIIYDRSGVHYLSFIEIEAPGVQGSKGLQGRCTRCATTSGFMLQDSKTKAQGSGIRISALGVRD